MRATPMQSSAHKATQQHANQREAARHLRISWTAVRMRNYRRRKRLSIQLDKPKRVIRPAQLSCIENV